VGFVSYNLQARHKQHSRKFEFEYHLKKFIFFQLKVMNKTEAIAENLTQQVVNSGMLRRITRLRELDRGEKHQWRQWSEGRRF